MIGSSDAKPLKIRLSLLGASGHVIREVIGTSAEGGVEVGRPGQGHVTPAHNPSTSRSPSQVTARAT
jgi:hypothetical protein